MAVYHSVLLRSLLPKCSSADQPLESLMSSNFLSNGRVNITSSLALNFTQCHKHENKPENDI